MNTKMLLALSAVIVVFIMAGQVVTYWVNPYHYDADAVISDGNIIFNINAPSSEYSVVAYDNGGFEPVTEIYVFIDAGYCSGQSLSDQRTFLNQLERELSVRGSSPPTEVNADELRTLMSEPGSGKGILMLSGAFPDTVYSGNSGDPVFSWLDSMGSIYWMNGKIGRSVSHDDGTTTALEDTDMLFFGMDGAVRTSDDNPIGTERGKDRALGEMLCVNFDVERPGDATNGLSDKIGGKTLSIGFADKDGYGSITLTDSGKGKGMIAVFGGGLTGDTRTAVAQVISSGISYDINTENIWTRTGTMNGTCSGTIGPAEEFTNVYIFLGKMTTIYGKLLTLGEET